ncbi:hypothetical protein BGZ83_011188, partial [Gryganskiella cystojenkinii]
MSAQVASCSRFPVRTVGLGLRYINAIEDRLHRMEAIVGGLVEDEPNSAASGDETGREASSSSTDMSGTINPAAMSTEPAASSSMPAKPRRRKSSKGAKAMQMNVNDSGMRPSPEAQPYQQPPHPGLIQDYNLSQQQQQHQQFLHQQQLHQQQQQQQHQHQQQQQHQHQHQQQFQTDLSFQSQSPFMQQQLGLLQQHPNRLDLQLDSSQSPDLVSQTHSDDLQRTGDPQLMTPLHQDILRESTMNAFNSPSPILGSEHSHSDYNISSPGNDNLPQLGMNTPPFQDLDDLEEDMGHLTLDHKGHERYVGRSSPMFYNRRHYGGFQIREREQPEARKFVENPDLPPPEVMTKLLNLYFAYVHPFAPVFVWSKFLKRLQNQDYSPSFLFLLNSIFALASRFSDDISLRTDPTKPETVGVAFVDKAKAILDTIYDAPDLYCVGALVILSYQQMGTGGGYRAWMFIGISIRMAQHLGLNRDCAKLNPHMPAIDKEERNRIWWSCFVADRIVSASFGRPQGINEHDVDATYPDGIDEENIQLEYRLDNATSMLTGPSPQSEMNFVYLASLTRIMGRVMVSLYSPLSRATMQQSSSSLINPAPLEQLDKELTDWLLTLPPHLQFRSVQQEPGTFVCTLHMHFYATLILLHRPYSHQSARNSPGDASISLSICTSAANNTIEMASNLMRASDDNRDVPRLKCLLHSAVFIFFTAGIVHITNCTSMDPVLAASAKLRTVETLRCLSVIEDVWMSGKWCGNNIKQLVKTRNIELPCSVEGFKYTLRNGADPASPMKGVILSQMDLSTQNAMAIPKEQNFAFDVDQIMGYYQAPGIRNDHAESLGRNSRHFSPTPYFSPHHAPNQIRPHPGLSQGHAPLPRRPRQVKNTSPSPAGSISSGNSSTGLIGPGNPSTIFTTTPTADLTLVGASDPSYFTSAQIDPFAAPGSATVVGGPLQPQSQQQQPQSTGEVDTNFAIYQNPFSSTLWNLPTSMDNEEWMLYMQNGGTSGVTSGPNSAGASGAGATSGGVIPNGNLSRSNSNSGNTSVPGSVNNSSSNGLSNATNSATTAIKLENQSVFKSTSELNALDSSAALNKAVMSNRMHTHPLAQSVTRGELLGRGGGSVGS